MAIKAGLEFMPPVLFAAFRYDLAAVGMLGYAAYATDYWRPRSQADWTVVGISAILIIAFYNTFLFVGQQGVTSGVAAILIAMNPILATGFSRLLLPSEQLGAVESVGLFVGFLGVGLVARPTSSGVLAAVCVALGSVLIQRVDGGLPAEGMVAWSTAFGAILLHAMSLALPSESMADITVTTEAVVTLVYLAVFASAVGYVIYFDLLDRLGAIEINLVSYTVPIFAALSGWLVLSESVDVLSAVGFAMIFGGFVLLKRGALGEKVDWL